MLFDLRGRGRRRTVRVVYLGLAALFALSFVGFGVGTGFSGGGVLEGIFGNKEGSNTSSFGKQVASAEARTRKHPNEAAAWAALADARVHEADGSEFYEEAKQQFTSQGKELLAKAGNAWQRYLAFNPPQPNLTVAQDMLRVFGKEGLDDPTAAVQALQIVIAAKPPSAALYGSLAIYAYQAKEMSLGDLAAKKAVSLSPSSERARVQAELTQYRENPNGTASGSSTATVKAGETGSTATSTAPPPSTTKTTPPATKK